DIAVGLFGTNDKLAFETVIVIVAAIIGAGLGIIAVRRSFLVAAAGFAAFALAGFLASLRVPDSTPTTAMVVAIVAAVAGVQVMSLLLRAGGAGSTAMGGPVAAVMPNWSRRGFLIQAGSMAVASTAAGLVGRRLLEGGGTQAGAPAIPGAVATASLPPGAELSVAGLTPLVVPADRFYRIDT